MSRLCNKCVNYYDDDLLECPYCNNKTHNIENDKVNVDLNIDIKEINNLKNEAKDEKTNIIFHKVEPKKVEQKDIINKKKTTSPFPFILFALAFILMFINVLYNVNEFDTIFFIHYLITSIILIISFVVSLRSISGYYIAIVASFSMILMIIEKDYTNFGVGIILFLSIFGYLIVKQK